MPEPTMRGAQQQAAQAADANDQLAPLRDRFVLPAGVTYLDGNSLGALPRSVAAAVQDGVTRQWGTDLITSWNDNGWWTLPRRVGDRIGTLLGAAPGQVVCGDSTSIQLFQALTALARANPLRRTLVTDGANFPTDQYLAESVAELLGLRLVRVSPNELDSVLSDEVAVVSFSAVDYRSGELFDLPAITAKVQARGAFMLWDLCHAAGAVPIALDEFGPDAAVGCTYKYLNGGPGAPAFLYLPTRHAGLGLPLTGWQGHAEPFGLDHSYRPAAGIDRGRIGTPPVLSMLSLEAALGVWEGVDTSLVRAKSLALTDQVIAYADTCLPDVEVVTPREHARRGSQVSLRMDHAYEVCQALIARGVIGDFRAPDLLRLGLTPLYLGYGEVFAACEQLREVLESGEYRDPRFARGAAAVT